MGSLVWAVWLTKKAEIFGSSTVCAMDTHHTAWSRCAASRRVPTVDVSNNRSDAIFTVVLEGDLVGVSVSSTIPKDIWDKMAYKCGRLWRLERGRLESWSRGGVLAGTSFFYCLSKDLSGRWSWYRWLIWFCGNEWKSAALRVYIPKIEAWGSLVVPCSRAS